MTPRYLNIPQPSNTNRQDLKPDHCKFTLKNQMAGEQARDAVAMEDY
jgi:hypothetical protein